MRSTSRCATAVHSPTQGDRIASAHENPLADPQFFGEGVDGRKIIHFTSLNTHIYSIYVGFFLRREMKRSAASSGKCQRDDGGLMGCCQLHLQRAVVFILQRSGRARAPSVGSQRQFFQARSHQFLSEGSPSNVLPFCCAVTCVIPQFIAL